MVTSSLSIRFSRGVVLAILAGFCLTASAVVIRPACGPACAAEPGGAGEALEPGATGGAPRGDTGAARDWAGFRGFEATGRSGEKLPPGDGPLAFEVRWKRSIGSGYAGIAVAEGVAVTAFTAGSRDVVAAFDAATGEERWRHDLAPKYAGHDGSHDGPIATPCIDGERVFALGPFGHLAAIDLRTGEASWTVHLVDDLGCEKPMYGFGSSPLVVGDVLVMQVGDVDAGSVVGIDAATGEPRWRSLPDEIFSQSPVRAEIAGRSQVLVIGAEVLAGLDPATGRVLFRHPHGGGPAAMGALSSSPLKVGADRLFAKHDANESLVIEIEAEGDGAGGAGGAGGADGADGADGPPLRARAMGTTRDLSKSYSPPCVWDGIVYGYTSRFLSAFDPDAGERLWKTREPGDGFLIAVDGQLVVLTKEGSLHLGDASPEGWSESVRTDLFEDLAWTPPSFSGGAVFARSLGEIARVDVVRGADPTAATEVTEVPGLIRRLAAAVEDSNEAVPSVVDAVLEGVELPAIEGEEVVFVWRGEADDVGIAGDMIGMRRDEPMQRLAGTDVWWWSTRLPAKARVNYLFFVDYEPIVDPAHDRTFEATVLGPDMNWRRAEAVRMSWLAMPEWPGHRALRSASAESESPGELERGRIVKMTVEVPRPSETGDAGDGADGADGADARRRAGGRPIRVPVAVWLPPGYDRHERRFPVVFVHDPFARTLGGWSETLERAVGRTVEPLIVAFVEARRLPDYEKAFVERIVPAVDERFRTDRDPARRANVGMGWQAHVAACITLARPDVFGGIGAQSFYGLTEQLASVREAMARGAAAGGAAEGVRPRVYVEWGRHELRSPHEAMDMHASSQRAFELLAERGFDPRGGEVWDSTDWSSWRNRTEVLLASLFPSEGTDADALFAPWEVDAP